MNKFNRLSWLVTLLTLSCFITAKSQAQVTSDGTLSTEVTTSDNRNFAISGNSRSGGNLFHSFDQFSIPNGGSATFNNDVDIVNIITRVTGGSISEINGLISARGNANLFLINPNGIMFGDNAQLSIGGSFTASTASRLNFADGSFFSASDRQTPPLLTVSVPNGLQFGSQAGSIINRSSVEVDEFTVGLQVQPYRTLALVGSNVIVENGSLTAPSGRLELGSVASNSLVNLTPATGGWSLGYENVQNFQDIQLFQSFIDTSFIPNGVSGNIQLQGKQIDMFETDLGGVNFDSTMGGNLEIRGSESIRANGSQLVNGTLSNGAAGNIIVETEKLVLSNAALIDTLSTSNGQGGHITINASDAVEINGNGLLTQITTQAFGRGNAGNIQVNTDRLTLRDGGQIITTTRNTGNGGAIVINAANFVEASGQGRILTDPTPLRSGIFAETKGEPSTGDGGRLTINTGSLLVQKGAGISVAAVNGSTGQAGTLTINASNSVEVNGIGSSLQASSDSPKPAGDLTINTNKLVVQDGAEISVGSTNTGNAGNLRISALSLSLTNRGKLKSTSNGGTSGGNIFLQQLNSLLLRGDSEISTNAQGQSNGGNITIATDLLTALENSKIAANAEGAGNGGNIRITTQGLFLSPDSKITATSERGIDGVVEINRPEGNPNDDAGSVPVEPVDLTELIATGCGASGSVASSTNKFIITGRGGLPPQPSEVLRSDLSLADLGTPVRQDGTARTMPATTKQVNLEPTPIVEAQGWVISPKGQVVLTASAPNVTPEVPWLKSPSCHNS